MSDNTNTPNTPNTPEASKPNLGALSLTIRMPSGMVSAKSRQEALAEAREARAMRAADVTEAILDVIATPPEGMEEVSLKALATAEIVRADVARWASGLVKVPEVLTSDAVDKARKAAEKRRANNPTSREFSEERYRANREKNITRQTRVLTYEQTMWELEGIRGLAIQVVSTVREYAMNQNVRLEKAHKEWLREILIGDKTVSALVREGALDFGTKPAPEKRA